MKEVLTLKGKVKIPEAEVKEYTEEVYQVYAKGGPYAPKKKHFDYKEACESAHTMSIRYPGKKFYVLKRVAGPYQVAREEKG